MFERVTPESIGISSKQVIKFIKLLEEYHLATHSIIMARGNKIFSECYYAPFNKDFKHRMYSVSKSFVSVAIGLLIEDGKLKLTDKFVDFFPEYRNENFNDLMEEITIRDALMMSTSTLDMADWFSSGTKDRTEMFFKRPGMKIPGTLFRYDSPMSYMLNVIVEKITGKPYLKFMQERFLDDIGFNKDSYCLTCPGGNSFGDSGVMCTSRDLLHFARFVMNKGTWEGKRYMNEEYLTEATKKQSDNNQGDIVAYGANGYGYQIWKSYNDGFAFYGMGDQFAICDPKTDFIFIINSDNQGNAHSRPILFHCLYKEIVEMLGEPMAEDEAAYKELCEIEGTRKLVCAFGEAENEYANEINGVTYKLEENRMGFEWIRFDFDGLKGKFTFMSRQGEKNFDFGMGYNEFCKFPDDNSADLVATVGVPGHKYDAAISAGWVEPKKIRIKVQIIDKYFGNTQMTFSFKDDRVGIEMSKTAEAFLGDYWGFAIGKKAQ